MKCCSKLLRYSLYLVVLLAVSGCSHNSLSYIFENKTLNLDFSSLLSKAFSQPSTYHVQIQASPDRVTTNYKSVGNIQQTPDKELSSVSESSTNTELSDHSYSFALQLISVESEEGLAYSFKKMVRRAPSIFQGKPILNVEVAQVNEHTYYRLKFGRYKYLKNAKADCEAIKRQGIDCWVGNYTDNRVYF
ncbi:MULTISPECIES: SPOR domain-containing protein [Pseudoalteromonas]|uniref:SPOR domain-containing protein n=1 Tax=Pseudoalteromonas TaxID=53246 RepID=UPI00158395D2|nr:MULTISPECIES: SPOR domain-containing protein [Pseudoalteromonas]MDI4652318.1 SPOR domain-containing protein [Pseudoalteromonas shioyasakiensis]NUJ39507.1 SPOR domain-containing protein [Pseudoalteromonas sp. 0303]